MNEGGFFLEGVLIGLTIAAAIGPISLLCIQRTLTRGWGVGLASGLGAATADGLYAFIGGLGLSAVSNLLLGQQSLMRAAGGLFLLYLGLRIFRSRPGAGAKAARGKGYLGAYASTFLLTMANPLTILSFAAVYAGIGLGEIETGMAGAGLFTLSIFLGSLSWWLILTGGVSLLRERFDAARLLWVNRVSGVIIAAFGLWLLFELLR